MDIRNYIGSSVRFVKRSLPTILTATGLVGVGLTAFLTGRAVLKADKKIKDREEEINDILTNTEKVKLVYTDFIPPVVAGVATGACIIGAHKSSAQQIATVVTAARNIEKQLSDNRNAVNELLGEKGLRKIDEKVNENRAAMYFSNANSIYETGHGSVLCCEGFLTGTLFRANREWVRKCVNDFNARLIDGEILSYNDFIQMLIPNIDINVLPNAGEVFGYNLDIRRRTLEIVEDSFLTMDSSEPGYIFNLRELPLLNYAYQY